jgi:hypothetical protein
VIGSRLHPATRDPSGVLPTVINDDPADWDIGGRLESHDGLEVHEWTFDDRILHASFDPDGAGPAESGALGWLPKQVRGVTGVRSLAGGKVARLRARRFEHASQSGCYE